MNETSMKMEMNESKVPLVTLARINEWRETGCLPEGWALKDWNAALCNLATLAITTPKPDARSAVEFAMYKYIEQLRELERALAAKTAECERLREDAERLDFLIDYCASFMNSKGEQLPENSRAAIDAARKETP